MAITRIEALGNQILLGAQSLYKEGEELPAILFRLVRPNDRTESNPTGGGVPRVFPKRDGQWPLADKSGLVPVAAVVKSLREASPPAMPGMFTAIYLLKKEAEGEEAEELEQIGRFQIGEVAIGEAAAEEGEEAGPAAVEVPKRVPAGVGTGAPGGVVTAGQAETIAGVLQARERQFGDQQSLLFRHDRDLAAQTKAAYERAAQAQDATQAAAINQVALANKMMESAQTMASAWRETSEAQARIGVSLVELTKSIQVTAEAQAVLAKRSVMPTPPGERTFDRLLLTVETLALPLLGVAGPRARAHIAKLIGLNDAQISALDQAPAAGPEAPAAPGNGAPAPAAGPEAPAAPGNGAPAPAAAPPAPAPAAPAVPPGGGLLDVPALLDQIRQAASGAASEAARAMAEAGAADMRATEERINQNLRETEARIGAMVAGALQLAVPSGASPFPVEAPAAAPPAAPPVEEAPAAAGAEVAPTPRRRGAGTNSKAERKRR